MYKDNNTPTIDLTPAPAAVLFELPHRACQFLHRLCYGKCRNDSPYIEKRSHYFDATLGRQFDAVAFWEDSSPVAPLDPGKGTLGGEAERHEVNR